MLLQNAIGDSVQRQRMSLGLFSLSGGLIFSRAFTCFRRRLFFGVGRVDRLPTALMAAELVLFVDVACFFPARRAASVDPMQALRTE